MRPAAVADIPSPSCAETAGNRNEVVACAARPVLAVRRGFVCCPICSGICGTRNTSRR